MKKTLFYAANFILAFALLGCGTHSGSSTSPSNSSSTSTSMEKDTLSSPDSHSDHNSSTSSVDSEVSKSEKIAYLTFDDGPSKNTPVILDVLKKYNVKATFFVIGNSSSFGTQMYKRIVDEGHAIGNHTFSHDYAKIYRSQQTFQDDFNQNEKVIEDATGVHATIMRFPGGSNNHVSWSYGGHDLMKNLAQTMRTQGYRYFDWNVDATDADVRLQNKNVIVNQVLNQSKNKQFVIILMHDASAKTTTPQALPAIIEGLKKEGFSFDKLSSSSFCYQFPL